MGRPVLGLTLAVCLGRLVAAARYGRDMARAEDCCCMKKLLKDVWRGQAQWAEGCKAGDTYVPQKVGFQCCRLMASESCAENGVFGFAKYNEFMRSNTRDKCTPGAELKKGRVVSERLRSPSAAWNPRVQVLVRDWEDIYEGIGTEKSNWNKALGVRVKFDKFEGKLHGPEEGVLELRLLHHGKTEKLVRVAYDRAGQGSVLEQVGGCSAMFLEAPTLTCAEFGEADLRKELLVDVIYWRRAGELVSSKVAVHRHIYLAPKRLCGVGFLPSAARDCAEGFPPVGKPLSLELPDYALGVEYELVAAPEADGSASRGHAEYNTSSSSLVEAGGGVALHCAGRPCSGNCSEVQGCLWRKLGWSADKADAWHMEVDKTVSPMGEDQTDDALQLGGIPFELVSPGPPHLLVGQRGMEAALDVLSAIGGMGGQAPLSAGLHLHVNVFNKDTGGGAVLSLKEIIAVYASWARFQHIIDEITDAGRVGNHFARGLYLEWGLGGAQRDAVIDILERGHDKIWHMPAEKGAQLTQEQGCRKLIGKKWLWDWCSHEKTTYVDVRMRLNPEKYFQINLTPIGRFGTIEFRSGAATLDPERAARWFQFLVGFVDTFRDTRLSEQFFDGSFDDDIQELKDAQRTATPEQLKAAMQGKVEPDFFEYFNTQRPYEAKPGTGCVNLVS